MRLRKVQKRDLSIIAAIPTVISRSGKNDMIMCGGIDMSYRSCRGESNFGVFASKNISAKSELFYDYNFSTFNGSVESHQQCHCASKNCRGLIGRKRKM
jgi:hypothetical protein